MNDRTQGREMARIVRNSAGGGLPRSELIAIMGITEADFWPIARPLYAFRQIDFIRDYVVAPADARLPLA